MTGITVDLPSKSDAAERATTDVSRLFERNASITSLEEVMGEPVD